MNLSKLFEAQKILDDRINKEHGLERIYLVKEKTLALLVELGQLANETRCFKFWSKKPPSERKVVLEEYVDGVHFIISLCIEKGCSLQNANYLKITYVPNLDLTDDFLELYEQIIKFRNAVNTNQVRVELEWLLNKYVSFGIKYGFTWEEIEQAYYDKNKINHTRQDEKY